MMTHIIFPIQQYLSYMQVDKSNFKQFLPEIISRIEQSDFVSFDC